MALDAGARDLLGFVGGIVEHLNLQQFARVVEARHRVHQPLDHIALVVDGELHGDLGPHRQIGRRGRRIAAILEVRIDQPVAVQAVGSQDRQHQEVRDHDREIEGVEFVEAAEGIEIGVGKLGPIVTRAGPAPPGSSPMLWTCPKCSANLPEYGFPGTLSAGCSAGRGWGCQNDYKAVGTSVNEQNPGGSDRKFAVDVRRRLLARTAGKRLPRRVSFGGGDSCGITAHGGVRCPRQCRLKGAE